MEVKLSKDEIGQIAGEVVKLLRREGLMVKSNQTSKRGRRPREIAEGYLSIGAAAQATDRHPHTIRQDIKSGKLKASIRKGVYHIRENDLARYAKTPKYARSK